MAEFHYQLGTHTKEQYDALDVSLRDADDPTYVARAVSQTDSILLSKINSRHLKHLVVY